MSIKVSNNNFVRKSYRQNNMYDLRALDCTKCGHNGNSMSYLRHIQRHEEIFQRNVNLNSVDSRTIIRVPIIFHILTPHASITPQVAESQALKIIDTLNNDFNNYSSDFNDVTTNNFAYMSIVDQVFQNSPIRDQKLETYDSYILDRIPQEPSNIEFSLGQIYFYPVDSRLMTNSVDENYQNEVRMYLLNSGARHIKPESFLNMWVVDTSNANTLAFSNFPWEDMSDGTHGVILHLRVFYPDIFSLKENNYDSFRTVTHEVGHWSGLLHVFSNDTGRQSAREADTSYEDAPISDPTTNDMILNDPEYNPLFMNFMDYTYDRYMASFTINQVQKMRYMLQVHRPNVFKSIGLNSEIPTPRYIPDLQEQADQGLTGSNTRTVPVRTPGGRKRHDGRALGRVDELSFVEHDVNFIPIMGATDTKPHRKVPMQLPTTARTRR
jgi:hypothetical protein